MTLLSAESQAYLDEIVALAHDFSQEVFSSQFYALEGLPCAGKTTTIERLGNGMRRFSELRIPPSEETSEKYLLLEPMRRAYIERQSVPVLSDRSIISTIAYKATDISFRGSSAESNLSLFKDLIEDRQILFPGTVIWLEVSTIVSRERQQARDRDILEGRLWYDPLFLNTFRDANETLFAGLYAAGVTRLCTESSTPDQIASLVDACMNYDNENLRRAAI